MSAPSEFGEPNNASLAGLVFDLASQLHVERTRRQALEAILARKGIVTAAEIDGAGEDAAFREANAAALDRSIRKLLRVLSEGADPRTPLRAEAPAKSNGDG